MKKPIIPEVLFLFFFLGTPFNNLTAQAAGNPLLSLKISLSNTQVADPENLNLKIIIQNESRDGLKVYQYLAEGYKGDNSKNLYLIVERKDKEKFMPYERGNHYQLAPGENSDFISRIEVFPNDTVIFYYHVSNSYGFNPGLYRLKCIYNNNILERDYVYSDWIYFNVTKYVPIKHYHEEFLQKAIWPVLKKDSKE